MGVKDSDPCVESHMWPQRMWGQRSCRGQWPFKVLEKWSLYSHTLMYLHGTWTQWYLGRVMWPEQKLGQRSSRSHWYLKFSKNGHCIHTLWCISMGVGHSDHWVELYMWPQNWGQRSSRGHWPFKIGSLYPHTMMYFHGSWTPQSLGRVAHVNSMDVGSKVI